MISCDSSQIKSHTAHPTPYSWASYSSFYCLVRGCSHSSFFFRSTRGHLISPPPIFLEHRATPQHRSMLCHTPLRHPTYKLYPWKLNHGQTIWDKKCYREFYGNTSGTKEFPPPSSCCPPKPKKTK